MHLGNRILEWLWPNERRRGKRRQVTRLAAYFWDGAEPRPHGVRDISSRGMYLLTGQRWYRNTLVRMTLVRSDRSEEESGRSIQLTARVVRSGNDGVGLEFVFPVSSKPPQGVYESDATKHLLEKFLAGIKREWAAQRILVFFTRSKAFA